MPSCGRALESHGNWKDSTESATPSIAGGESIPPHPKPGYLLLSVLRVPSTRHDLMTWQIFVPSVKTEVPIFRPRAFRHYPVQSHRQQLGDVAIGPGYLRA